MKKLAIITARGGSKRIPGKNIRSFFGKPIIAYPIEKLLGTCLFDEIMVSTDDSEIAAIAKKYGDNVPFLRSKANSGDFATTADVILEVLTNYKALGKEFEYVCCIYPTAALISKGRIEESFNLLKNKDLDVSFPVLRFDYSIWRSFALNEGVLTLNWPENETKRSQDLPEAYHDAGQFYWLKASAFLKQVKIFMPRSGGILLDQMEAQDIDTEADWELAEVKYKLLERRTQ